MKKTTKNETLQDLIDRTEFPQEESASFRRVFSKLEKLIEKTLGTENLERGIEFSAENQHFMVFMSIPVKMESSAGPCWGTLHYTRYIYPHLLIDSQIISIHDELKALIEKEDE